MLPSCCYVTSPSTVETWDSVAISQSCVCSRRGEFEGMTTFTPSSSSVLSWLQHGYQHATRCEVGIDENRRESKRSREFFDSESDMDVDIVRDDDDLYSGEEYDQTSSSLIQSDGKRMRRMWKNGNIELLRGLQSPPARSTPMSSPRKIKTSINGLKRNRSSFHQSSYDHYVGSKRRNENNEIKQEDDVNNDFKKLKMKEDTCDTKLPTSRRLPAVNCSDEISDIDFLSVNQVLNELYRERCFRKNVSIYSALADSSSNVINSNNKGTCSVPKNEGNLSSVHHPANSLYGSTCSSIPP